MMAVYCGIDLHSSNGMYAFIDESGKRRGHRRLPNEWGEILTYLSSQPEPIAGIAVESTYNWYWLVDALEAAGYPVVLANPNAIDQYDGLKGADDTHDAYFLAELQRLGILPTGYICPKGERSLRDLLRRRMLLVRYRTGLQLSLQGMLTRETGLTWSWRQTSRLEREEQAALLGEELQELVAQKQRGVIERLDAAIGELEEAAEARARPRPEYELLRTAPGVGRVLGLVILAETGPIERFAGVGNYTSYCRLTAATATSNGRRKRQNNRKNGNRYLAWAYAEAAIHARRCSEAARHWYNRKLSRCGGVKPLAAKALAAKWCKASYYVLKNREPFVLEKVFG